MLDPGSTAPDFTALNEQGQPTSLSDYAGRWVLLWWYPKALTPGCTSCGSAFQARLAEFAREDCSIIGVSFDPPELNLAFARRQRFAFPLLSASYDVGRLYGTKREDTEQWSDVPRRVSYLIGPEGRVRASYRVLDPSQHPERVLADLRALRTLPDPGSRFRRIFTR